MLLVIPIGAAVLFGEYAWALALCFVAGFSDMLDGYIARRWQLQTELGAILDPLADKVMMLVIYAVMAQEQLIPLWLAFAVIGRDLNIVLGVIAWKQLFGPISIEPSIVSKLNTAMQISLILLVLTQAAYPSWLGDYLPHCFTAVLVSTLLSWLDYGWMWWRRAWQEWLSNKGEADDD